MSEMENNQNEFPGAPSTRGANTYLDWNNFLTPEQKAMAEAVYRFPAGIMHYSLAFIALWVDSRFIAAFAGATVVGVIAWSAARFLPGRWLWPIGFACGGPGGAIACAILAVTVLLMGGVGAAIYLVAAAAGITKAIDLPAWLWAWSSRDDIHPVFRIANRMFGLRYPFETKSGLPGAA